MENAVDALKIAFAVFVFAIAAVLTFSIVGQARATSDIVLTMNDKTSYYDYVNETETNAEGKDRIVGFETLLPTIYRYAKEQYAVTILKNDGTPIVRYDLYTEGFMGGWDETIKNENSSKDTTAFKEVYDRIKLVDDYIYKELGKETAKNAIWKSLVLGNRRGEYVAGKLYEGTSTNNTSIHVVAPWMGNPNTDAIYRIHADMGANGGKYTKDGITYNGKNLELYKDKKFKEKFLEIQTSGTTVTEVDENNNIEYSIETVKGNKKLEIIYIMQD